MLVIASRIAAALGITSLVAAVSRLRGTAPSAVTRGGWRPVGPPDYR